jgi:acyl transferase domain-containing protein
MLGHSIGEYVAACVAGVMTLEEALEVVAARGKLMQGLPRSGMMAVEMGEEELGWAEEKGVSIAAVNGPGLCVLSGLEEEMEWVEEELKRKGVNYKRLKTSHGFHSRVVEPVMGAFLEEMKKVKLKAPKVGMISNVSGGWMGKEAEEAEYWVKHLRARVQFEKGLKEMVREGEWMLVECGPGQSLRRLAQRQGLGQRTVASLPVAGSGGSEVEKMVQAAGELWKVGVGIDWEGLHGGERGRRVPLPTYPFERKRYWIEPSTAPIPTNTIRVVEEPMSVPSVRKENSRYAPRPALRNNYIAPHNEAEQKAVAILEEALGIRPIGVTDQYGELGGDSLTAIRVIDQLNTCFQSDLRVVDLYEGLAIRDLVRLIAKESVAIHHDAGGSAKADRRQLYQQSRRSLHQTESA